MPRSALLAPIALLVVAMVSIQSGASLAKSLFPIVGAEGTTTLRLVLGAIILSLVMQPWRAKLDLRKCQSLLAYGLALGGMNLLFYMSLQSIPLPANHRTIRRGPAWPAPRRWRPSRSGRGA